MIVTINTDASFSAKHKVGSFAFWIVCDQGKIAKSGILRRKVGKPDIAEFRCVINALHVLINSDFTGITRIIFNTDCLNVCHLMQGNKREINKYSLGPWGHYLVTVFNETLKQSRLKKCQIEFRHVKAHVSTDTARQWVNDWCDKEAKKQIAIAIKSKLLTINKK